MALLSLPILFVLPICPGSQAFTCKGSGSVHSVSQRHISHPLHLALESQSTVPWISIFHLSQTSWAAEKYCWLCSALGVSGVHQGSQHSSQSQRFSWLWPLLLSALQVTRVISLLSEVWCLDYFSRTSRVLERSELLLTFPF